VSAPVTADVDVVSDAVSAVLDPEMGGVSIGDLGLVEAVRVTPTGRVEVDLVPTFLGCPALDLIERDVVAAVTRATGSEDVLVSFVRVPSWSPQRISPHGRRQLAALGIAVDTGAVRWVSVHCPVCGTSRLRPVSEVGPTACRSVAWCDSCRNPIEVVRR